MEELYWAWLAIRQSLSGADDESDDDPGQDPDDEPSGCGCLIVVIIVLWLLLNRLKLFNKNLSLF